MTMPRYLTGFANHHASEAVPGALPVGRNSPQRAPFGLYAEQLSGTAFTAPRAENRRSWLYRLRPTANHPPFRPCHRPTAIVAATEAAPNRLRWDPLPWPVEDADFIDGLVSFAGNGDVDAGTGVAIHHYACNRSMENRVFFDADGEWLIVPQQGRLRIVTEFGLVDVAPLQIAILPRGVRFRVELPDGSARGYVAENRGPLLRLPDLGPIGANGLANPRDFEIPVAAYEDRDAPTELVQKYGGRLWTTLLDHSPLDVVAWHGNLAPCRYDLTRFNTIGSIGFDHPDPSIFTVLTSPSATPGTANLDFVIFPPRWMVAEDTFRPPWFHRNVMSEYMGLIAGAYDGKDGGGFAPGGASLHNRMAGHGPDRATWEKASTAALAPVRIVDTMAFMFESYMPFRVPAQAAASPLCQLDYDMIWTGFEKARLP